MHDIEPFTHWRDYYVASEDKQSPFYGRVYDEFQYTQAIYNYYIHPQWDGFGSPTLYTKILFVDYEEGFAVLEMLGEWNDCIQNDIMFLKRDLIDWMTKRGICKFVLICENVLNFHGSDDCYYEEWYEDVRDEDGWICFLNLWKHVEEELLETKLQHFVHFGRFFNLLNWRAQEPLQLLQAVDTLITKGRLPQGVPLLNH
ncbi:MAG: hypothetical protein IPL49_06480 [Saprospirales bacterium]|nr:hypothetical protein [Saprospirales bacterium]MBK8490543.1 hypothetical protein [Saprospirales bacterium]